jgi:hypothetical protein
MNESQPSAWVTYVSVDNADATVKDVVPKFVEVEWWSPS